MQICANNHANSLLKVYHSIAEFKQKEILLPVMTTGTFDGVHLGHRVILDRLNEEAKHIGGESVLLTFFPHPRMVLFPEDHGLQLLNTLDEKLALLKEAGVQHVIVQPFTKAFAKMSALEYVKEVLVNAINVKKMVIGYDHHFGKNREGDFELLQEYSETYGFEVAEIPPQELNEVNVSSTKIRKALAVGEVRLANRFLQTNYSLTGTIIKGRQLGSTIGFPTANIKPEHDYKLIPANGVYAVTVNVKGAHHSGMMNIGFNPTVEVQNSQLHIEVHLFNFNEEVYNEKITVTFLDRIRQEKKFHNVEALGKQLQNDKNKAMEICAAYTN